MRPVSIDDFIRIVHADDSSPPTAATIRKQCNQQMIPGAYKVGKPWKIDLDVYLPEMRRRITGESDLSDDDDTAFIDELEARLAS